MRSRFNYSQSELVEALRLASLQKGDTVFSHVAMLKLGLPTEMVKGKSPVDIIIDAILEVIGSEGTFITPTYTYSFCKNEIYDPINTASEVGPFGEELRKRPGFKRSLDPIFSVTGCGPRIDELFNNLPNDCFGRDCIYGRLAKMDAKICNIGLDLSFFTAIHHLEQTLQVPYRYLKPFTGYIHRGEKLTKETWIYCVRMMDDYSVPNVKPLDDLLQMRGQSFRVPVGRGQVTCAHIQDAYNLAQKEVEANLWFLAQGLACDPLIEENKRVGGRSFAIHLGEKASMQEMVQELWSLPRDIVSDGYDAALEALSSQLPMNIHAYPTGTECFTWVIPEKWTCHEAYLENLAGERLFSYKDNPLHVVSYSLPYTGELAREELFNHLHVHPRLPDAVPFVFKYYERDWGLCCSQMMKDSLKDDYYRVTINTDFSYATLKVGEVVVAGESDDCFVLCAHLCHPAMVNDDLSGVVVGLEVMRELMARKGLRYTYRFLILPETIGSAAYLSQNQDLITTMRGGLFLEMLGSPHPHALQLSLAGNTQVDKCVELVVKEHDPASWTGDFLTVIFNDERMFNAPGIGVPMLSLSRVLPPGNNDYPYREYHSNLDTPENINFQNLEDSRELVLKIIDAWEANRIPEPKFKGELFFSRFRGIDYATMQKDLHQIMFRLDGHQSVADIACNTGIDFSRVKYILDVFEQEKLINYVADNG